MAFGLVWSRSAVTGGVALACVCAMVHADWRVWLRRLREPAFAWPLAYFALAWVSYYQSADKDHAYNVLINYLPMALFPLGFAATKGLSAKQVQVVVLTLALSAAAMGLEMSLRVLTDMDGYADLLRRGKSVPTPNGILPISLGVLQAFSAVASAAYALESTQKAARLGFAVLSLLLVAVLHLLANRTGLLCLYAVGGFSLLRMLYLRLGVRMAAVTSVTLAGLLAVSVALVPPLRAKASHGWQDLRAFYNGDDLSDWSLGRRLAASHAAWLVFADHSVFGAGIGDAKAEVLSAYEILPYRIAKDRRANPHLQLLNTLTMLGATGGVLLLGWWLHPYWRLRTHLPPVGWLLLATVVVASLTDSILEQQIGLNFVAFFLLLFTTQRPAEAPEKAS